MDRNLMRGNCFSAVFAFVFHGLGKLDGQPELVLADVAVFNFFEHFCCDTAVQKRGWHRLFMQRFVVAALRNTEKIIRGTAECVAKLFENFQ